MKVEYNPPLKPVNASKMPFDEWDKAKQEEKRRITNGAKIVSYKTDSGLYHLEGAILECCFRDKMFFHNLYFIPPALDFGSNGLYGHQCIMISKPYWEEHGLDDEVIDTMFHECVHAWDAMKSKHDTDGDYHNTVFKETCELFGGLANFTDKHYGFNDAHLTEITRQKVKRNLAKWIK